jgi:very-short-patch-repair endonuclease
VWWKCHKGHEWQSTIYNRNLASNCPYCSGKKVLVGYNDLKTINPSLADEWNHEKNLNLSPQDVTIHSSQTVWWYMPYDTADGKHYDFEWKSTIGNRANGSGCPFLIEWKTEKLTRSLLTDLKLDFKEQERFKETGKCKFDFYLPDQSIIIEPDGMQHFKPVKYFNKTGKEFKAAQKRDCLKNNFCLNHNIAILRIPYIFDATKDEDKIKSMITQLLKDRQVPNEILDFYKQHKDNNYYEIATKLNSINNKKGLIA